MKICLINPFSRLAAIRQYNLAKAMASIGNDVTLILPRFDKYSGYKKINFERIKNLKIIHPFQINTKNLELSMLFYITSAIKALKKNKFNIVHGFRPTPFSGYLAYRISKKQKIPFVLEMGDIEWQTMKALSIHPSYRVYTIRILEKYLIKKADGITSMSSTLAKHFENLYKKEVKAVPSGIDINLFSPKNKKPELRKDFENKLKRRKIMAFVGKLDKSSHVTDLIKVLTKVKNIGLIIIGDGNGKSDLEKLARTLGVYERCYFIGRLNHEEIPFYLNASDILVAPFSKSMIGAEFTLNLKILEYMGMEKPMVVSEIGLLKNFLKDCAFLYKPNDINSFAKQIDYIIKNRKEATKTAKNARKKILNYSWDKLAKDMIDYYKDVIKRFSHKE